MDGSYDNWELLLQFVASIIDRLPRSGTRVGAVLFSDRGELLFTMDEHLDLDDAKKAILTTRYPGANTNTSGGIYRARADLFNPNRGDRPNVPNLAIIITDGKSTFDNEKTIPFAKDLHRDGVQVVSIGVTNSVDADELKALSSMPQERNRNYFTSPDFQQLGSIIDRLLSSACVVTATVTTMTTTTRAPTRMPSKSIHILFFILLYPSGLISSQLVNLSSDQIRF